MKQDESKIQQAFFEWLSLHEKKHPELSLFYAIPNGANKSIAARMKFKREGLKAGVPDVHLPLAAERFHSRGLWIEFKSAKGVVSESQKTWSKRLQDAGHSVVVCKSWTDAANIVIDYLALDIPKFQ